MDNVADNYIDFNELMTASTGHYKIASIRPSGALNLRTSSPINEKDYYQPLYVNDQLYMEVPKKEKSITPELDDTLWESLKSSAKLVSKGRRACI